MTYCHPNAALAVPNLVPRMINPPRDKAKIVNEDRIMLVSSWKIRCGIALYTEDLINNLNKIIPDGFFINPINNNILENNVVAKLTHIQHEFGIIKKIPNISGKVIITWHTVTEDMYKTVRIFESNLDVVAHIVTCENAKNLLYTPKDLFFVNIGSTLIPEIEKDEARRLLNINIDKPIGFVFGFQSKNKNYQRLIDAANNKNIHLIISGSYHECMYNSGIKNTDNVSILNRFLSEEEVNLYALASDILLYDYADQDHYSSSSALHRTIGAGRPVICTNTNHFSEIKDGTALKFNNQVELENCIQEALEDQDRLGKKALEFSKKTSWEEVAKKHIEIYRRYVDLNLKK